MSIHDLPRTARRILLLTDCYRPAVNGVITSIVGLRDGLRAQGHDVRVLTFADAKAAGFDGEVYRLPSIGAGAVYPHARLGRPMDRAVLRQIVRWSPQVLHSHTEFVAYWWARRLAHQLGSPHVHTYHTLYEDYTHYFCPNPRLGRAISATLTRRVVGRADHVIAPTGKIESLLRGYGLAGPITVVPTGIDLTRFSPTADADEQETARLRQSLGLRPGVPVVLSVGRLATEKNLGEAIGLLARVRHLPWQAVIVGDGPQGGALRDLVRRLHLSDRVCFTGAVPPDRVPAYFRLGDVFVSASASETQGLTCLEALASGVPALCRADPCLEGVVRSGVNGWQYEGADDFVRVLGALLTDPALRRRWAHGAAVSGRDFGVPRFAEAVCRVYDEASARLDGVRRRTA